MKKILPLLAGLAIATGCTSVQTKDQMRTVSKKAYDSIRAHETQPSNFSLTNTPSNINFPELPKASFNLYSQQGTNEFSQYNFNSSGILNDAHNTLQKAHELEEILSPSVFSDGAYCFTAQKKNESPIVSVYNFAPNSRSSMRVVLKTVEGRKDKSSLVIEFDADKTEFKNTTYRPLRAGSVLANTGIGFGVGGIGGAGGVLLFHGIEEIVEPSHRAKGSLSYATPSFSVGDPAREAMLNTLDETKRNNFGTVIAGQYLVGNDTNAAVVYLGKELKVDYVGWTTNNAPILTIQLNQSNKEVERAFIGAVSAATRYSSGNRTRTKTLIPAPQGGGDSSGGGVGGTGGARPFQ